MATIRLPKDFQEFLKSFKDHGVEYLLVGGYAVGYHGYVRATGDIDVWVACNPANAARIVAALRAFGFDVPNLSTDLFLDEKTIVQLGVPPLRIDIMVTVSGVEFPECFSRRVVEVIDDVEVAIVALRDLKANKKASGRPKDLVDYDALP